MIKTNQKSLSCLHCFVAVCFIFLSIFSGVYAQKYKICVVPLNRGFKRTDHYCPILDKPGSRVECVLGVDRLDCLRRISKGTVDFTVLTAEDLVTARNSEIEVLVTNELRYTTNDFEYEVVAIIRDSSGIKSRHDLRHKSFCHPGYGYETDWTTILSNYLEASVVPQLCDAKLTLTENRIRASSMFFKSACKAGPWVNNPQLDLELKAKYPNLCSLCDNPNRCSTNDKYWGRRGPLYCLTDGAGDVSWARLDDVQTHFGFAAGVRETTPEGYSYLCADGTTKPLNSSIPCVWVVKPWPVVAAKRTSAQEVQDILSSLTHNDPTSWQSALLTLTFHFTLKKTHLEAIESYLDSAVGFLAANSFTGCHPPRTIRICTTSIVATAKCSWLRESAAVYGVEPDLECLKADNVTHCARAVAAAVADVVVVPADAVAHARRAHRLKTLFYETVADADKYLTVAVVLKNASDVERIEGARGAGACFPAYDGVAWNTVASLLANKSLVSACPLAHGVAAFFGPSCAPNAPHALPGLNATCGARRGGDADFEAIRCLVEGRGGIAFVSKNALGRFLGESNEFRGMKLGDFRVLCERGAGGCHLSWATPAQAMVRGDMSGLWMRDALDVFQQLDLLFGAGHRSLTVPIAMFGAFDGRRNVLFDDATIRVREVPVSRNFDPMLRSYVDIMPMADLCSGSGVNRIQIWVFLVGLVAILV